jgi:hypothetical protein
VQAGELGAADVEAALQLLLAQSVRRPKALRRYGEGARAAAASAVAKAEASAGIEGLHEAAVATAQTAVAAVEGFDARVSVASDLAVRYG